MAAGDIYKLLLLGQSVMFIIFAMVYLQKSNVEHVPIRAIPTIGSAPSKQCNCAESVIRLPCPASNGSHPLNHLVPTPAQSKLVPGKGPLASAQLVPGKGPSLVRGPITNCSVEDIKKRPGVVLLTTTNLAYLDMTLNMLLSIKQAGICVNTTIYAEEQKAYDQLSRRLKGDPTVRVLLTVSAVLDDVQHQHKDRMLMNRRQRYILELLERGYEVLFTDGDTFWFRDPFPFFQGEFDISLIDSRSPFGVRTPGGDFCAGFVYFKPTNASLQLVKAWRDVMESNAAKGLFPTDQHKLNGLLKTNTPVYVKIKPLDTNIFPWGPKFYSLLAKKANYSTVVMHAASIRGHAAKVAKFKSSNMWLVNKTTEELVAEPL